MRDSTLREQIRTTARFCRFALPHWKMMLVAFVAMTLTSALWGSMILLLRPVLEGAGIGSEPGGAVVEEEGAKEAPAGAEAEEQPVGQLERAAKEVKEELTGTIVGLGPIKRLRAYVGPGPDQLKHVAFLMLFLLAPLWVVFAFLETYCTGRVLWQTMANLRVALFEKLSRMPLAFFGGRRTGDLISRLTNDVGTTKSAAGMLFTDVLKHPIQVVVLLLVAFSQSWQLTLVVLATVPVVGLVMRRYGSRIQKHGRKSLERTGDITDAISQMFSGIRVVKAFGMEDEENEEFRERNRRQVRRAMKLVRNRAWADCLPQAVAAAGIAGVLLLADYLINQGVIDFKTLVVVLAAVSATPRSVKRIVKVYSKLRQNLGAFDRIFELLDQKVTITDAPDATAIDGVEDEIRFDHVWFAYQDEQFVLRDIHLAVPAGTICALVGETGAGKSTMLDLIPRFYDPQRGAVRIDGRELRRIGHESLLEQIAIVGQHPFLFNRTVAENIRYGHPEANREEVQAAARAANIHDFIESLPEGYETMVGEQGSRLSGGQRQCITIARALLKDAPILILDEATSNLDSESEALVQQALTNLMKGRTTFVIAHRLSTVRFADRIVVLKDGQIVEQGTHEQLLAAEGEYAKLHRIQFSDPLDEIGSAPGQVVSREGSPGGTESEEGRED